MTRRKAAIVQTLQVAQICLDITRDKAVVAASHDDTDCDSGDDSERRTTSRTRCLCSLRVRTGLFW